MNAGDHQPDGSGKRLPLLTPEEARAMRMRTLLVAPFCALQAFLIVQGAPVGVILLIGLAAAGLSFWDARRLKEMARDRLKHPLDAASGDRVPRSDV